CGGGALQVSVDSGDAGPESGEGTRELSRRPLQPRAACAPRARGVGEHLAHVRRQRGTAATVQHLDPSLDRLEALAYVSRGRIWQIAAREQLAVNRLVAGQYPAVLEVPGSGPIAANAERARDVCRVIALGGQPQPQLVILATGQCGVVGA